MRFFRPIAGLSGWQRFGFEVAIIVIGVGLAMLADQLITSANRKAEMRQAMQAVENDLMLILFYTSERAAIDPCRRDQVERLLTRLEGDGEGWTSGVSASVDETGNPMILQPVLRTPIRNWADGAWKALVATDAAIYMDRGQFVELSGIFDVAREVRELQTEALALKGQLAYLAEPGRLPDAQRIEAHASIGRLSAIEGLISIHAGQTLQRILALNIDHEWPRENPDAFREAIDFNLEIAQETYGDCLETSAFDALLALAGPDAPLED